MKKSTRDIEKDLKELNDAKNKIRDSMREMTSEALRKKRLKPGVLVFAKIDGKGTRICKIVSSSYSYVNLIDLETGVLGLFRTSYSFIPKSMTIECPIQEGSPKSIRVLYGE